MDADRWQRIQDLFHEAAEQPQAARSLFIATACGDDAEAAAEVLALLEEDSDNSSILDQEVHEIARYFADRPEAHNSFRQGPTEIGPYRIVKLLGEGGMGVVYLAERQDLGSEVAIKILPNAWMSPARRERFAVEERSLSRLNHPSIARLYDAGTLDDGTPWFAMEYVEGVPLTEYCETRRASLAERLSLFRRVCEAVQYAHGQAILHRDLKPSNILAKADGTIRLLDFGIAKQLDEDQTDVTRTGLRLATPAYASPEQLRGEPAAVQSDVYSLGVILYQLVAGRLPFAVSGCTEPEAAALIDRGEPEPPSMAARKTVTGHSGSWGDLDVLCLKAIHRETGRRYQSVEALIRDIDHLLKNEPLEARPDAFAYRLGKFVTRRRHALAASLAVLTAMVGMLVWFTMRLASARDAALAEAARAQRIQSFMLHVFEGGDVNTGPAEGLRVTELIDRSAREVQALDADPAVQADLYQTLGNVYHNLGKMDQAERFMAEGLRKRRQHPDQRTSHLSEHLVTMGLIRIDQGRRPEAEKLIREGLSEARNNLPAGHPAIVSAMNALGRVFIESGRYDDAIRTLEEALHLQSVEAAPTQTMANTLIRLANTHYYLARYDESEALNHRVMDLYRKMYGERAALLSDPLINLGSIAHQRAKYSEAERFYRLALASNIEYYGERHPETAFTKFEVGKALALQNRPTEAEPLLKEALTVQEAAYGPDHSYVATTLNSLAQIELAKGNLASAERHFNRVLKIYRMRRGERHPFVGQALTNLAGVYMNRLEFARAESTFREALALYAESLPPDHTNVGVARVKLGRSLLSQKRFPEAEKESLAGLQILQKKADPSSEWIVAAQKDLSTIKGAPAQSQPKY